MNNEKKSIGAWKKQTSKGEVIKFTINGQKYSMWQNTKKSKDTQPDYNIIEDNYVKPNEVKVGVTNNETDDLPF